MNISNVKRPTNMKFGLFFTAVFTAVGAYLAKDGVGIAVYSFFCLAITFLLVTIINANWLLPLNKLWMSLGILLGMIVSPLVMGIIFFGIFSPVSLIMRLLGRDELRLKLTNSKSHWKKRNIENTQNDTFKQQF